MISYYNNILIPYNKFYDNAFGGFEDLESDDTDTDSEGYVKI